PSTSIYYTIWRNTAIDARNEHGFLPLRRADCSPLLDRRRVSVELGRAERAAVEQRRHGIGRLVLAEELGGEVLCAVLRHIAEELHRGGVVPPAARVVGDAVGVEVMDLRRLDAALHELHRVAVAEPGAEMAPLDRALAAGADAQRDDAHAVLVG